MNLACLLYFLLGPDAVEYTPFIIPLAMFEMYVVCEYIVRNQMLRAGVGSKRYGMYFFVTECRKSNYFADFLIFALVEVFQGTVSTDKIFLVVSLDF